MKNIYRREIRDSLSEDGEADSLRPHREVETAETGPGLGRVSQCLFLFTSVSLWVWPLLDGDGLSGSRCVPPRGSSPSSVISPGQGNSKGQILPQLR